MNFRLLGSSSLALLACASLVGCGQKLANLKVDPASATLQAVDETSKLKTQQLDPDGKPLKKPKEVTWTSSDPSIASIAADGTATAHKSGKVSVTAKADKVTGQGTVEVHIPSKITAKDLTFTGLAQTQTITLQVLDDSGQALDDATSKLTVVVANGTSATVDGPIGGPWTVKSAGGGVTTLTAASGALSKDFAVKVNPEVTGLKLDPLSMRLKVGESVKLTASPLSGDQPISGMTPTFTSSNPSEVGVDSDGTVHGLAKGKATITVVVGGKQGTVTATVRK